MTDGRAVVIARGEAALRASAWLARGGSAVRHLGLRAVAPEQTELDSPWLYGQPWVLEPWVGRTVPVRPRRHLYARGRLVAVPRRRRDLARLAGGSLGALARDLRPRLRSPRTLGQWGERTFGRKAWRGVLRGVVSKRLGVSCDAVDPRFAALLLGPEVGAAWRALSGGAQAAHARRVELVLDAGGEVLDGVHVEGLEVVDGRIVAVLTEFGREHVPGRLYTDLRPERVAAWLPRGVLAPSTLGALRSLPLQERSVVVVSVDASGLPWEAWVADADVPIVRFHRPAISEGTAAPLPRTDQVVVELECLVPEAEAEALAVGFLAGLGLEAQPLRVLRRAHVLPVLEGPSSDALQQLWALGVTPVGAHASHLSLSMAQEAVLAASWNQDQGPSEAMASWLVPPSSARGRELLP